jgi:hypothetical protein
MRLVRFHYYEEAARDLLLSHVLYEIKYLVLVGIKALSGVTLL